MDQGRSKIRNEHVSLEKWKRTHNIPKLKGLKKKGVLKGQVTALSTFSIKRPQTINLYLTEIQKEQTKLKVSRRKERKKLGKNKFKRLERQ